MSDLKNDKKRRPLKNIPPDRFQPKVLLIWVAIVAAVLMTVGKEVLGLYLGRAAFSDAFGAAGSLVVLVMWIYYSVQVFLFGAAYNETRTQGRREREGASHHKSRGGRELAGA